MLWSVSRSHYWSGSHFNNENWSSALPNFVLQIMHLRPTAIKRPAQVTQEVGSIDRRKYQISSQFIHLQSFCLQHPVNMPCLPMGGPAASGLRPLLTEFWRDQHQRRRLERCSQELTTRGPGPAHARPCRTIKCPRKLLSTLIPDAQHHCHPLALTLSGYCSFV